MATNAFWSANAPLRPIRSGGNGYTSPKFSCEGTHVHDQFFCPETHPHPRNDRRRDAYLQFQSRQLAGTRESLHVRVDIQYRRCHPALMVRHPQKGPGIHAAQYLLGIGRSGGNIAGGEFHPLNSFSRLKFTNRIPIA